MPAGRGNKHVHSTFSAADYALLKVEASHRRTSVNALVHDSINLFLNPEKAERGILLAHMETLSDHLSKLVPQLQTLERATARTEGLSRALDTLRSDQRST